VGIPPETFDWTTKGRVTPVKDQGMYLLIVLVHGKTVQYKIFIAFLSDSFKFTCLVSMATKEGKESTSILMKQLDRFQNKCPVDEALCNIGD